VAAGRDDSGALDGELHAVVELAALVGDLEAVDTRGNILQSDSGGRTSGSSGKHLDVLQVGASTGLQSNGAASVTARVLEGERLALNHLERGVEELGLGESNGSKGRDGSDRILHLEFVEGRERTDLNERRKELFNWWAES